MTCLLVWVCNLGTGQSRGAAPPAGPEEYAEPRLPIAARERDLGCMHHHVAAVRAQPIECFTTRHVAGG